MVADSPQPLGAPPAGHDACGEGRQRGEREKEERVEKREKEEKIGESRNKGGR